MSRDLCERLLRRGRWLVAALAVAVLASLLVRIASGKRAGDTRFYRHGAALLLDGRHLYFSAPPFRPGAYNPNTGYTYLPPFAVACLWMLALPYGAVRVVWLLAMFACLLGSAWLTWRLLRARPARAPPASRPHLVACLTGLLVARFALNDLAHGQVNGLVTLLLLAALLRAADGRDRGAGVLLGFALLIKPTSWLLVPWFLLRRRWRLVAACALTAGVALALPGLRYGAAAYAEVCVDWLHLMRMVADHHAALEANHALSAALTRILAGVEDRQHEWTRLVFALEPRTAIPLARAASLCVAAAAFAFLALRRGGSRRAPAAVLVLGLLASPVAWKAHLVVLVLPAAFVASDLAEGDARWPRWLLFAGAALLLVLPSRGVAGLGLLESLGALPLGAVLLLGLLLAPPAPTPEVEAPPRPGAGPTSP